MPFGGEKKTNFAIFGLQHLVVSLIGSVQRKLNMGKIISIAGLTSTGSVYCIAHAGQKPCKYHSFEQIFYL